MTDASEEFDTRGAGIQDRLSSRSNSVSSQADSVEERDPKIAIEPASAAKLSEQFSFGHRSENKRDRFEHAAQERLLKGFAPETYTGMSQNLKHFASRHGTFYGDDTQTLNHFDSTMREASYI